MIISGRARGDGRELGQYLVEDPKNENENIHVLEVRGVATQDPIIALEVMDSYSQTTNGYKGLYHAQINPEPGERMRPEDWQKSADRLEKNLGLEGQPRVIVMHEKKGRHHMHVAWSRVDIEKGKMITDSHNYAVHQKTAQELEQQLGHKEIRRSKSPKAYTHKDRQFDRRKNAKEATNDRRARIRDVWQDSRNGEDFIQQMNKSGYQIVKGEKGRFLAMDQQGRYENVTKAIKGLGRQKDVMAKLNSHAEQMESLEVAQSHLEKPKYQTIAAEYKKLDSRDLQDERARICRDIEQAMHKGQPNFKKGSELINRLQTVRDEQHKIWQERLKQNHRLHNRVEKEKDKIRLKTEEYTKKTKSQHKEAQKKQKRRLDQYGRRSNDNDQDQEH